MKRTLLKIGIAIIIIYLIFFFYGILNKRATSELIVVFGNTINIDGTPSNRLAARLDKAYEVAQINKSAIVMVSGAKGVEGFYEGNSMKSYLVSKGLEEHRILVDNTGYTTRDTVINTQREIQIHNNQNVTFISQYFHKPRVLLFAHILGIENPAFAAPYYVAIRDLYSVPREFVALVSELAKIVIGIER